MKMPLYKNISRVRIRSLTIVTSILALSIFGLGCIDEQHMSRTPQVKSDSRRQTMFGINLRPEAARLQEEVEALYYTKVLENGPCEVGRNEQAASCVSNGIPIIKFNPQVAPTET